MAMADALPTPPAMVGKVVEVALAADREGQVVAAAC